MKFSKSTTSTVFIGDSIISGLTRYKSIWSRFANSAVNHGIRGAKACDILELCKVKLFPLSVSNFIIQAGTNDLNSPATTEEITNTLIAAANTIRSRHPRASIGFPSVLPRDRSSDRYSIKEKVRKLNIVICIEAKRNYYDFIETASNFEIGGKLIESYYF